MPADKTIDEILKPLNDALQLINNADESWCRSRKIVFADIQRISECLANLIEQLRAGYITELASIEVGELNEKYSHYVRDCFTLINARTSDIFNPVPGDLLKKNYLQKNPVEINTQLNWGTICSLASEKCSNALNELESAFGEPRWVPTIEELNPINDTSENSIKARTLHLLDKSRDPSQVTIHLLKKEGDRLVDVNFNYDDENYSLENEKPRYILVKDNTNPYTPYDSNNLRKSFLTRIEDSEKTISNNNELQYIDKDGNSISIVGSFIGQDLQSPDFNVNIIQEEKAERIKISGIPERSHNKFEDFNKLRIQYKNAIQKAYIDKGYDKRINQESIEKLVFMIIQTYHFQGSAHRGVVKFMEPFTIGQDIMFCVSNEERSLMEANIRVNINDNGILQIELFSSNKLSAFQIEQSDKCYINQQIGTKTVVTANLLDAESSIFTMSHDLAFRQTHDDGSPLSFNDFFAEEVCEQDRAKHLALIHKIKNTPIYNGILIQKLKLYAFIQYLETSNLNVFLDDRDKTYAVSADKNKINDTISILIKKIADDYTNDISTTHDDPILRYIVKLDEEIDSQSIQANNMLGFIKKHPGYKVFIRDCELKAPMERLRAKLLTKETPKMLDLQQAVITDVTQTPFSQILYKSISAVNGDTPAPSNISYSYVDDTNEMCVDSLNKNNPYSIYDVIELFGPTKKLVFAGKVVELVIVDETCEFYYLENNQRKMIDGVEAQLIGAMILEKLAQKHCENEVEDKEIHLVKGYSISNAELEPGLFFSNAFPIQTDSHGQTYTIPNHSNLASMNRDMEHRTMKGFGRSEIRPAFKQLLDQIKKCYIWPYKDPTKEDTIELIEQLIDAMERDYKNEKQSSSLAGRYQSKAKSCVEQLEKLISLFIEPPPQRNKIFEKASKFINKPVALFDQESESLKVYERIQSIFNATIKIQQQIMNHYNELVNERIHLFNDHYKASPMRVFIQDEPADDPKNNNRIVVVKLLTEDGHDKHYGINELFPVWDAWLEKKSQSNGPGQLIIPPVSQYSIGYATPILVRGDLNNKITSLQQAAITTNPLAFELRYNIKVVQKISNNNVQSIVSFVEPPPQSRDLITLADFDSLVNSFKQKILECDPSLSTLNEESVNLLVYALIQSAYTQGSAIKSSMGLILGAGSQDNSCMFKIDSGNINSTVFIALNNNGEATITLITTTTPTVMTNSQEMPIDETLAIKTTFTANLVGNNPDFKMGQEAVFKKVNEPTLENLFPPKVQINNKNQHSPLR